MFSKILCMKVSSEQSWIDLLIITSPENFKHLDKKRQKYVAIASIQ